MKLSIIIITKNEEKYLPKLLDSILHQSVDLTQNTQLILSDADSDDKTKEIFKEFCVTNNFKFQIVQGGLPSTGRNKGAEVAKGEFLLFLDADICLNSTLIENFWIEQPITKKPIYSPYTTDENKIYPYQAVWKTFNFLLKNPILGHIIGGFCIFVSRESFETVGKFNEDPLIILHDVEFVRRFGKNQLGVISDFIQVSHRRFEKIGFWNLSWFYIFSFFKTLFGGKYNDQKNQTYFKVKY